MKEIIFAFIFALIFANWKKIKRFLLKNRKSEIKKLVNLFNDINPNIIISIKNDKNQFKILMSLEHSIMLRSLNIDEKLLIIEKIPSSIYISGKDNQILDYIMDREQNGKMELYKIKFTNKLFKIIRSMSVIL
jgi:hypothetical protein